MAGWGSSETTSCQVLHPVVVNTPSVLVMVTVVGPCWAWWL